MKYRKLPVVIEAFKLTNQNGTEQPEWIFKAIERKDVTVMHENGYFVGMDIKTLEGTMRANFGDYIIKGVNGEIYPCKPDIFEKTYELADGPVPQNKNFEIIKSKYEAINQSTDSHFTTEDAEDLREILSAAEHMAKWIEQLEKELIEFKSMISRYSFDFLTQDSAIKKLESENEKLCEVNAHKNMVIQDLQAELKKAAENEMELLRAGDAVLLDQTAKIRLLEKQCTEFDVKYPCSEITRIKGIAQTLIKELDLSGDLRMKAETRIKELEVTHEFCETMRKENEFLKGLLGSRYPCNCEKFCVFKINRKCNHHGACDHRGELETGELERKSNISKVGYNPHKKLETIKYSLSKIEGYEAYKKEIFETANYLDQIKNSQMETIGELQAEIDRLKAKLTA